MKNKLYLLVIKGGFFLGGIRSIRNRHFHLKLVEDDGTYEITDGMVYGDTWVGFGKKTDPVLTHINFVNDYLEKGYIKLVDDPTIGF